MIINKNKELVKNLQKDIKENKLKNIITWYT
jgi:hypothetical protein